MSTRLNHCALLALVCGLVAGCSYKSVTVKGTDAADADTDTDVDADTDASTDASTDADADTDTDRETETDADTGAGTDTEADTDTDVDSGTGECGPPWGWYDERSGLCWENPPITTEALPWDDALAYCEALQLGGHDDWRLPSISELRSLVRGCEATMTGGECGVTDECYAACWDDVCQGPDCDTLDGPGVDGMYWDSALIGGGVLSYWSSTPENPPAPFYVWYLLFHTAMITSGYKTDTIGFRCVRTGLL